MERARCSRARRGRGRVRPRSDWMDVGARQRPLPCSRAPARRRPVPAVVAGAVPRVRGGLRRAPRSAVHDRRGRRQLVARRRPSRGRRAAAPLPRPRRRRVLHDRDRRRAARRAAEGRVRRRDPFRELARGQRSAAPRRSHRRRSVRGTGGPDPGVARGRPMATHPTAFAHLLAALERELTSPLEIAIVGDRDRPATARVATRGHQPARFRSRSPSPAHGISDQSAARRPQRAPTAHRLRTSASTTRASHPATTPAELRAQIDDVLGG